MHKDITLLKIVGAILLIAVVLGEAKKEGVAEERVEVAREMVNEGKKDIQHAVEQISKAEQLLEKEHPPSMWERVGHLFGASKDAVQEGKENIEHEYAQTDAKQAAQGQYDKVKEKAQHAMEEGKKKLYDAKESAKDKLYETKESAKDKLYETKESVKEALQSQGQKIQQLKDDAKEKLHDITGKASDNIPHDDQSTIEKVKEKLSNLLHGGGSVTEQAKEKAQEYQQQAKEKAQEYQQQAKENADKLKEKMQEKVGETQPEPSTIQKVKEKITGLFGSNENEQNTQQSQQQNQQQSQQQQNQQDLQSSMDILGKAKQDIENKMKNLGSNEPYLNWKLFSGSKSDDGSPLQQIRETLDQTEQDMNKRMTELNKLMSQFKSDDTTTSVSTFQKIQDSIEKYAHDLSKQINTIGKDLQNRIMTPFRKWKQQHSKDRYLLQACKYLPGLTITYINENGEEFLDISGENATDSIDQLKILNEFRQEFILPLADSIQNISVYIHPLKQPRVLVKAINIIEGIEYRYQYDNGKESMNVTLDGDNNVPKTGRENEALNIFRLAFGIKPKPKDTRSLRDEL